MLPTLTTQLMDIEHTYLADSEIHILKLRNPSRQSVDDFIDLMNELYQYLTENDVVRLLVDYRESGVPPISYAFKQGAEWSRNLAIHPPVRVAIVHRGDPTVTFFGRMIPTFRLGHLQVRFFQSGVAYEQALEWLKKIS